jgi:hypothetical protein
MPSPNKTAPRLLLSSKVNSSGFSVFVLPMVLYRIFSSEISGVISPNSDVNGGKLSKLISSTIKVL